MFSAKALTIVDVSGPRDSSGLGIGSTQQLSVNFSIAETYKNITISAFLAGFDTVPYNAFLTTRIGPGTDPLADEVARWNGNTPEEPNGPVAIFTGLLLTPGIYYLTLSSESQTAAGWFLTSEPQITAAPGASVDFQGMHYDDLPEYPPAAFFFPFPNNSRRLIFSVESLESAAIPEPSTVFAGFVALAFVAARSRQH